MRGLLRNESGTSSVEFTLVALVFFLFVFGIVDFGRAMWQWNAAAKATQMGARFAVVSAMAAPLLATFDGIAAAGGNGLPVPEADIVPNPVICNSAGCNGYGWNGAAFTAIVNRMQQYNNRIQAANVVVEYRHVGLGFAGNPFGPDFVPVVTVRLRNMTFNFVTPLVAGLATITMPDFRTTLTGEDMNG